MIDGLIRQVADEMEIRNLVARIAFCMDVAQEPDEYLSLICEDGRLDVREDPNTPPEMARVVLGHAELRKEFMHRRVEGYSGPGSHTYHTVVSTAVTLDGDVALARTYMTYLRKADSNPEVGLFKIYHDNVVRTPDGWKLKHRIAYPG